MASDESVLITPRRNFLIRALGFTAAGAALSVPIVTMADAKARYEFHKRECEKAFRELYRGFDIDIIDNAKTPERAIRDNKSAIAIMMASRAERRFCRPSDRPDVENRVGFAIDGLKARFQDD